MIIEFPKKYDVRMHAGIDGGLFVSVPNEYRQALIDVIEQQPWIQLVSKFCQDLHVYISRAYVITDQQAHDALCQLCEHVMSPPVEVDREVWGDAIGGVAE